MAIIKLIHKCYRHLPNYLKFKASEYFVFFFKLGWVRKYLIKLELPLIIINGLIRYNKYINKYSDPIIYNQLENYLLIRRKHNLSVPSNFTHQLKCINSLEASGDLLEKTIISTTNYITAGHSVCPKGEFNKQYKKSNHFYFIKEATIFATNLIKDNFLITIDSYRDPLCEYTSGFSEIVGRAIKSKVVYVNLPVKISKANINTAILFSVKKDQNYFHFTYELMTKMLDVDKFDPNGKLPLLINQDLPPQFFDYMNLLFGEKRDLFCLNMSSSLINIDNLYAFESPLFLSDNFKTPGEERVAFSAEHLLYLQDRIWKIIRNTKESGLTNQGPHKRIYIDRSTRNTTNSTQLKKRLKEHGFKVIRPENLPIMDQIILFMNAEIIVGAAGAAISNILYCKPGTKIVILNAEQHADNCVFSSIAKILNLDFQMVLGKRVKSSLYHYKKFALGEIADFFTDFEIDIKKLEKILNTN